MLENIWLTQKKTEIEEQREKMNKAKWQNINFALLAIIINMKVLQTKVELGRMDLRKHLPTSDTL